MVCERAKEMLERMRKILVKIKSNDKLKGATFKKMCKHVLMRVNGEGVSIGVEACPKFM
jgi:hypothetical protein